MFLPEAEIQPTIDKVKAAFPGFTDWEFNNEKNDFYHSFSVWGEFVFDDSTMPRIIFFITFDCWQQKWCGHLTSGKPQYYWSDTEDGDACLVHTGNHDSLDAAIVGIKTKQRGLFAVLCGEG